MTTSKIATINNGNSGIIHFIDSNRGVYIPQSFMQMIDKQYWQPITHQDEKILLAGPDIDNSAEYWETWTKFIDGGQFITDQDGDEWRLHQDGDVFLMCFEKMTDEEKQNFEIDE